jgi:predicted transcriptional regulator
MGGVRLKLADEPHDHAGAMTFDEIGRALGISRSLAWTTYARAIQKLRRRKIAMRELRELAKSKELQG